MLRLLGIALLKVFGMLLLVFGMVPIFAESFAYLVAIADAINGNELSWPDHALPAIAHIVYPLAALVGGCIVWPPLIEKLRNVVDVLRRRPTGRTGEEKTRDE